ncbi:MAG: septum site-determining protein MinC [Variovorax sp.]
MADVSAAERARAVFEFKSATLPLIAIILKTPDLDLLAQALAEQLADTPDFFEDEPVVIDLSQLASQGSGDSEGGASPDFARLRQLLAQHRTQPIAVRGANPMQAAAARAAGLSITTLPVAPPPRAPAAAPQAPEPARSEAESAPQIVREYTSPPGGSVLVERPLRSGQQVYARGGDLIVLDVVNFGAEVIADGHIHVYAPLRGKAMAGARGDTEARIFSTCMEAQLVAIAGIYRTAEVALPTEIAGKAAQVRLEGEKLLLEPLQ